MTLDIHLLGEVRFLHDGQPVNLGPRQQRTVFVALLTCAGRPVSTETLIKRVWDGLPPAAPRKVLNVYLSRIRRLLEAVTATGTATTAPITLRRTDDGYLIDIPPDHVDLHRFRHLLDRAMSCPDPVEHLQLLEQALDLWTGPPLDGMEGTWVDAIRDRSRQEHLEAAVHWAETALELGHDQEVMLRLAGLAEEYPLAEPLAGARIRALVSAGREAEALACFADLRRRLLDHLGTGPGPELTALHTAVLRGEPVTRVPPAPTHHPAAARRVPAQLPGDVRAFVGRETELRSLHRWLDEALDTGRPALLSIVGADGVGKTGLAVHWAHQVAARFPHGQLFVELGTRRHTRPASPEEALTTALRCLGAPSEDLTGDRGHLAARYRNLLADLKVLVVLDDARDADQVRPLIPGAGLSAVLVTSRAPLPGLVARDGARRLHLDPLPTPDATTLVQRLLTRSRSTDELQHLPALTARCGGLPLALRRAAEHAQTHPTIPLNDLANTLPTLS
ncbi:MAG: hypothetical protein GXX79_20225 [Actinomycetales bacterium]|nr:hypothetical protein [Actinomycetales bacterium]